MKELINRPSCYNCYFCSENRYSDFTIADFWGIENYDSSIKDDDTGISLLCVNTKKGKNYINNIKNELFMKQADIIESFRFNHHKNTKCHKKRNLFFHGLKNNAINEHNIIYYMNKYTHRSIIKKVISKLKRIKVAYIYRIRKIINK